MADNNKTTDSSLAFVFRYFSFSALAFSVLGECLNYYDGEPKSTDTTFDEEIKKKLEGLI